MFTQIVIIFLFINSLQPYIFSKENEANELISQGRVQYQLLRERGSLPKYGSCWKSALEIVDNGCRELSEETQSDIALALANCFLDMSGLETHHCEMDKKQNLRRICVSSMSDKAFNVYTEFYTHTLNMCWFLRGQIWQETISENTLKVGKQLETSAAKQEILLEIQRESLDIQSTMLQHSKDIESVLSDLSKAAQNNKEILLMLGQAVNDLQSWLIGEVSWINTLVFYVSSGIFFIIVTSTRQTIISRLPILTLLMVNLCIERVICSSILSRNDFKMNANQLFGNILDYVQVLRYCFLIISFCILFYKAYFYEDPLMKNKAILLDIFKQNQNILENLKAHKNLIPDRAYLVYKADSTQDHNVDTKKLLDTEDYRSSLKNIKNDNSSSSPNPTKVRVTSSNFKYNLRKQRNTTPVLD
ncbi:uncharacterized protein LOC123317257 [Coccinella septempunctata]|uniref:uncharacterized protein LOC123317257 n=1 Tax=Coccinella septempunctata TaxID=41139 RepID=UPI001D07848D|nr:uncharacterized protein LOC123317257 [Coccinella septempunctata]